MSELAQILSTAFVRLDLRSFLDIFIVALILYLVLILLRGTTAMSLLRGIITILVFVLIVGNVFQLTVLNWLVRNSITALLVAIPIIFQPELRRALERIGRTGLRGSSSYRGGEELIDSIAFACRKLADRRYGALIVIERETGLQEYADTGIEIDGIVTTELLVNIFFPNSPLHDGAVILRDNRLVAASCVLPLSENPGGEQSLGTRHRAAIGIAERTDALSLVVSEETGMISVANNGRLVRNVDESRLRRFLETVRLSPSLAVRG